MTATIVRVAWNDDLFDVLQAYEQKHMVPDPINKEVAEYTTEELLYTVPKAFGIRKWVEGLTVCMLDEPVRIAMMCVHIL